LRNKLLLIFLIFSAKAFGYPQFIGFGYKNCITCHYNPYGNGPLKDYGRALSGTLISDRALYPSSKTEESIGKNSGFTYRPPFVSWLRPSLDYRGMWLMRDLGSGENTWINMQLDGNLVFKWGSRDQWYASLTYGYVPTPMAIKDEEVSNSRSREHYIAWRPIDKFGIYLGLMDIVYGIRIPEHIAVSRGHIGLGQNDQTHGALLHYVSDTFEAGLHGFAGNLTQDRDLRQKGGSFSLEYAVGNYFKPGISGLASKNDYLKKYLAAFHTKIGYPKGSATLFEFGMKRTEAIQIEDKKTMLYLLYQNYMNLRRGLFGLFSLEYAKPNTSGDLNLLKFNLGVQYFLVQGVELRVDLVNSKAYQNSIHIQDMWDFLGQVHLWF
jgi:hypothetical protein